MNTVNVLIRQLETTGYEIRAEVEEIVLKWTGGGEPSPENIPLLKAVRERKAEALGYLKKQADCERMFNQALEEINGKYVSGAISYTKENHPDLWHRLVEGENRLSEAWLAGDDDEFKKNLDEWITLNHKAVEIFRERGIQRTLI